MKKLIKKLMYHLDPIAGFDYLATASRMKQVQNNIDMYTAIINMPNTTKIKNNL